MSRSISPFSALWAVALLALIPEAPCVATPPPPPTAQQPAAATQQPPVSQPLDFVYYGGKIKKRNGSYILQDSTMPVPFLLDNQPAAKKFVGRDVVVMGVMLEDTPDGVRMHVVQIESVEH